MKIYVAIPHNMPPQLHNHMSQSNIGYSRFSPAHMVYRVRGTRLYLAKGSGNVRGGVMVISTSTYTGGGPSEPLLDDIADEIRSRDFEGIVLDTGSSVAPIQTTLAGRIVSAMRPFPVYAPTALADVVDGSVALVQTALSGGSLERHLETAISQYGKGRVAIECDRIHMDFALPAHSGVGEAITKPQSRELMNAGNAQLFFSEELCTNYFTYGRGKKRHIVLLDDDTSIKKKLELSDKLGISRAFLYYPHVYDILVGL